MADFMPPFELFTRILGPEGGRRRLLQRLGPDAAEPIETFLAQALAYEEGHPASLQGFLHWLGLDAESLKRDMERGTDAVRVMTVHGAKGLEAPIVFLAEAGPYQPQDARDRLLYDPATGLPLWRAAAPERDPVSERICDRLKAQSAAERCRLFYVAMTRARDRLYVTGWAKRRGSADGCWHDVIGKAIRDLPGDRALRRRQRPSPRPRHRRQRGTAAAAGRPRGGTAARMAPPPAAARAQDKAPRPAVARGGGGDAGGLALGHRCWPGQALRHGTAPPAPRDRGPAARPTARVRSKPASASGPASTPPPGPN
jgi:ATP-dependent exoDNAse (exonuclease V) beta subunit